MKSTLRVNENTPKNTFLKKKNIYSVKTMLIYLDAPDVTDQPYVHSHQRLWKIYFSPI